MSSWESFSQIIPVYNSCFARYLTACSWTSVTLATWSSGGPAKLLSGEQALHWGRLKPAQPILQIPHLNILVQGWKLGLAR